MQLKCDMSVTQNLFIGYILNETHLIRTDRRICPKWPSEKQRFKYIFYQMTFKCQRSWIVPFNWIKLISNGSIYTFGLQAIKKVKGRLDCYCNRFARNCFYYQHMVLICLKNNLGQYKLKCWHWKIRLLLQDIVNFVVAINGLAFELKAIDYDL